MTEDLVSLKCTAEAHEQFHLQILALRLQGSEQHDRLFDSNIDHWCVDRKKHGKEALSVGRASR